MWVAGGLFGCVVVLGFVCSWFWCLRGEGWGWWLVVGVLCGRVGLVSCGVGGLFICVRGAVGDVFVVRCVDG